MLTVMVQLSLFHPDHVTILPRDFQNDYDINKMVAVPDIYSLNECLWS